MFKIILSIKSTIYAEKNEWSFMKIGPLQPEIDPPGCMIMIYYTIPIEMDSSRFF